jgi:hypothetical protein
MNPAGPPPMIAIFLLVIGLLPLRIVKTLLFRAERMCKPIGETPDLP